ncbi:MAG TPA: hypothetical protein PK781_03370 [Terrimesophilobacter sp.]|nr:hypothetical protein [Terrimesophilobacter sp.]HRP99482.1 hypothetical protein [Terrimesophilobacter sp.]
MSRTNPILLTAALATTLLVTACSAGPLGADPTDPGTEPSASVDATPDAAPVVTREQCVIGTWQVDNAAFESWMNTLVVSVPVNMAVSGSSYMRFDDQGSFFTWRDDFTFTTTAEGQTVTHISNSGETGDYGLVLDYGAPPTVDFLWVAETMRVVHDEVMIVGGIATLIDEGGPEARIELFDGYTGEVPTVEGETMEGSLPFTCDDDTLVFEFDAGNTMPFNRTTATP